MATTPILAPDPTQTIGQLTSIFNSANGVTQWATALVNAVLPAMSPTPDWYSEINKTLSGSQGDANNWLNQTGPEIVSGMCMAFLDYSGTFAQVIATQLQPILAEVARQNGIPTSGQQQQLVQIFTALQQSATRHATTTGQLLGAMSSYKTDLHNSLQALNDAIAKALPADEAAKQKVQQIHAKINDIEVLLAADSQSATDNSLNIQSAVTSLVVGLAFSTAFDPVGFGIALLGVGTNIVLSVETQEQVQADLKEIAKLADSLAAAEIQLGLLQGVVANLKSLATNIKSALAVYSDFDDSWQSAQSEIANLLVTLNQPEINTSKIPQFANLQQASEDWEAIAKFASNVLLAKVTPQPGITISSTSVAPTVPALQKNLVANLNLTAHLTAWCSAIVNTTVAPSPGNWYPTFMKHLGVAQSHATQFLSATGPDAISTVPNSIVSLAATQREVLTFVQNILHQAGANDLTSMQLNEIKTLFGKRLQPKLESLLGTPTDSNLNLPPDTIPTLYGTKNDIISFRTNITADHNALVSGQQGAAAEVGLLDSDIEKMRTAISSLQTEVSIWNQDIEESEIGIGASIFAAVVGIGLALATGGGALVLTGIGVAGLGGSIAATAVYSEKVKAALKQIQTDQTELSVEQQQVASLLAIIHAFEHLAQLNAAAQTAAEQIVTMFAGLVAQTEGIVKRLEQADSSTAKGILENIRIEQVLSNWSVWSALAEGVLNSTITKQTLSQPQ